MEEGAEEIFDGNFDGSPQNYSRKYRGAYIDDDTGYHQGENNPAKSFDEESFRVIFFPISKEIGAGNHEKDGNGKDEDRLEGNVRAPLKISRVQEYARCAMKHDHCKTGNNIQEVHPIMTFGFQVITFHEFGFKSVAIGLNGKICEVF